MSRTGLEWNAGAWFGSQLGGTCWMAVGAGVLSARGIGDVGLLVGGLFLLANALGTALWCWRARLRPLTGYSALVVILVATAFAGVLAIHLSGSWEAVQIGGRVSPIAMYALLGLMLPAMLWQLRVLDRRGGQPRG